MCPVLAIVGQPLVLRRIVNDDRLASIIWALHRSRAEVTSPRSGQRHAGERWVWKKLEEVQDQDIPRPGSLKSISHHGAHGHPACLAGSLMWLSRCLERQCPRIISGNQPTAIAGFHQSVNQSVGICLFWRKGGIPRVSLTVATVGRNRESSLQAETRSFYLCSRNN